ncbi:hypothetical protein QF036_002870 [Arthrobacter globiformis]|nr:hypothetical protein [Arthrobacter globiformis]
MNELRVDDRFSKALEAELVAFGFRKLRLPVHGSAPGCGWGPVS